MIRVQLRFDRTFSRPNSFFWIADIETVRCRIQLAAAAEVSPVDVHLRFRGRGKALGLVHCRPIDGSTFVCESAEIHPDLPRMELLLCEVPEPVATSMMAI